MTIWSKYRAYWFRLLLVTLIAFAFSLVFNEVTYSFQREATDRPPETIELVIPPGTAELVAAGQTPPEIPASLTFVVGDVLRVVNQDSVEHTLGPVYAPPGATASLSLDRADTYSYSCSFRAAKFLGIEVKAATDLQTRLVGLFFAAPTLAALMFVYSLVMFPIKDKPKGPSNTDVTLPAGNGD
jgi:hypothetical protein